MTFDRRRFSVLMMGLILVSFIFSGCSEPLRLAPGESQKQNAFLHQRTTMAAALQANGESGSESLRALTAQSVEQATAMLSYFGMPKTIPPADSVGDLLSEQSQAITKQATVEAGQRPDPWAITDNLLELGLGLAGLVGGVYGTKAVRVINLTRTKSKALQEIVSGNELFKQAHPDAAQGFKAAHGQQSTETQELVTQLRNVSTRPVKQPALAAT